MRIIYQFVSMQNPFLYKISALTPKYTKSSFFRQTKFNPINHKENSFKSHHKQHNSLLGIYAEKIFQKKMSVDNQNRKQLKETLHRAWIPLNCKDNDLLLYTIQNKNNKNKRVQSTISSVNNYTQELRMTLLNQYKIRKHKELLKEKQKFEKYKIEKEAENPEIANNNNPSLNKYTNNNTINLKTINLLYKAIIDSSFHKRKKQQFEVYANRLPIINRHQGPRKRQIMKHNFQLQQKAKLQHRKTFLTLHNQSNHEPTTNKLKNKYIILKDNVDIFPWKSDDQEVEQN